MQNELSRIIGQFQSRRAAVIIDAPEPLAGHGARVPTASVTIFMTGTSPHAVDGRRRRGPGRRVKAGLDIRNADRRRAGQQPRPPDDDMLARATSNTRQGRAASPRPADGHAVVHPGVIIAVNAGGRAGPSRDEPRARLGPRHRTAAGRRPASRVQQQELPAEPARPNTGISIDTGGSRGNSLTDTQTETEVETQFGRTVERVTDPRGMPLKINATVNIPRSFFVAQWRAANNSTETPGDDVLAPVIQQETGASGTTSSPRSIRRRPGTAGRGGGVRDPQDMLQRVPRGVPRRRGRRGSSGGGGRSSRRRRAPQSDPHALAFAALAMMALTVP